MTSNAHWSHEASFTPVAVSASEARAFVCVHLNQHDLAYLIEDIRLVVSELVTNAVVHARTPLTVTIQELPASVVVAVHDDSPVSPVSHHAQPGDTGGRGLEVVDQCCSDWGVSPGTDGGKSVWASFAVRPLMRAAVS